MSNAIHNSETLSAPEIPAELEQLIWQVVTQHSSPLKEYHLLKTLAQAGYTQFELGKDALSLFQAHFMLFHLLYRLQNQWLEAGLGTLYIHTLEIRFEPFEKAENLSKFPAQPSKTANLDRFDPLKTYYLDFSAYYQTQSDEVRQLLKDFWLTFAQQPFQRIQGNLSYQQALTLFDLEPSFSPQTLKQRYRQLRQQTHPDKGGNASDFQQVLEAYEILQATY